MKKRLISIIVTTLLLLTIVFYHSIVVNDLKKEYDELYEVYENCASYRQDYVMLTDSIFVVYEDSIEILNLRTKALEE